MKSASALVSLVALLLAAHLLAAQTPQAVVYQGLAVQADGSVATSAPISIRLSLLQGSSSGSTIYVETHQSRTNSQGFFSVALGQGARMGTTHLADIEWHQGPYYLKSEIDIDGNYEYRLQGISQLISVPYAFHAHEASSIPGVADTLQLAHTEQLFAALDARQHIDSTIALLRTATIHCLPGCFSVAPQRTVQFSPGNLQYRASTATWRFAPQQYAIAGNDNNLIASNYDGWIDLFGWGTSGWHGAARAYLPYAHSGNASDYIGASLTDSLQRADWGVNNIIDSAGYSRGLWRTLTASEMTYLLDQRAASTIGGTADARYCYAVVNNVRGLILFPDQFILPTSVPTPAAINQPTAAYNSNTYSAEQWATMEQNGAVFLPAAGSRNGNRYSISSISRYWTSTASGASRAYALILAEPSGLIAPAETHQGLAVRLVHE